jgi:hypothetical protein
MSRNWHVTVGASFILSLFATCVKHGRDRTQPSIVDVTLGGSVSTIKGLTWPKNDGALAESIWSDKEAEYIVRFSQKVQIKVVSRMTFIDQRDGLVSRIKLTPLKAAVSFADALAAIQEIVKALKLSQGDGDKTTTWKEIPPKWSPFNSQSMLLKPAQDTTAFIEIKPAPEMDKWFVSYAFAKSK